MPNLLNIQSSNSGLNNIITSDVAKKHYYFGIATKLAKTYQNLRL